MSSIASFFVEFVKHPATVGSICPSSRALAAALIKDVPRDGDGLVIDLGAGSGPVSAEMLRSGIAPERIIAIDALPDFQENFRARCPGVRLVIGDARALSAVLDEQEPGKKISAIVSSLPFRSFGPQLTADILREVRRVLLEKGGFMTQFSYAWWLRYPLKGYGLTPVSATMVCRNLPPARVETYRAAV